MKLKKLLGALALTATLLPLSAHALIYNVNRVINTVGTVAGTVTTDGTFGVLSGANVTAWSLTIDDGDGSGPFLLTDGNGQLLVFGTGLTADADSIDFDFSGPPSFALFQNPSIGSSQNWWCVESAGSNCAGTGVGETVNRSGAPTHQVRQGVLSIATIDGVVPEPATLLLAGLALLGVAGLRGRSMDGL